MYFLIQAHCGIEMQLGMQDVSWDGIERLPRFLIFDFLIYEIWIKILIKKIDG